MIFYLSAWQKLLSTYHVYDAAYMCKAIDTIWIIIYTSLPIMKKYVEFLDQKMFIHETKNAFIG